MAHENSPSSVMYAELKDLGLKNRDAAAILLDTDRSFDGATILGRIESRSQLSRTIVHIAPGELPAALFRDFSQSVPVILGRVIARLDQDNRGEAIAAVAERFAGPAATAMQQALVAYQIEDSVYRNALSHITNLDLDSASDKALLYLMLFVVTGCTGDPHEAAKLVERFSREQAGAAFRTVEAHVGLDVPEAEQHTPEDAPLLALARIVGGRLKGNAFYRLSPDAHGTEIGTLSSGASAITDVDEDVSRRHARIYLEGGRWYIVGMKSTNGTTVISGADKLERIVEAPRKARPRDYEPTPFEIHPADTICLGASTRFMVVPVAAG